MIGDLPIHFIRPAWLLAAPVGVVLPLLWRHFRRPSGDWARACDAHLLRWLSVGDADGRRSSPGGWLAGAALVIGALALSGPSWVRLPDASFAARDQRVLVLDLSRSMLAQDLKPNRVTQVRYRLSDILEATVEGQVGLVAYAGDAYVVSPLTSDTNTIANMLPALQPDIIPVAGSRADRGLELAAELLERTGAGGGEILLISDGANAAAVDVAARLAGNGISTSVLAVGTSEGAPIPSGNGFVTDAQGNIVIARLDSDRLRALAQAGGGRFTKLDTVLSAEPPWHSVEGREFSRREDGLGERWKDAGPWLVLLLLPLAALAFRRGLLFMLPLVVAPALFAPVPATAGVWEDLWWRRDQQAEAALEEAMPGEAAVLAKDPVLSGEAWYRSGEYQRAAQAWSRTGTADAHYNRGNALALAGAYEEALAAYGAALALNPEMEDALHNRAVVEQWMEQQKNEQGADDSSGEGEQQEGDSEQSGQDGESDQQQGEQQGEGEREEASEQEGESGREGQAGEDAMAQAWTEEDAQAMEQWLRRIPDDPGGLLRRKFRNEHQRRGAPPDEKQDW